jgi:hypothetical protein
MREVAMTMREVAMTRRISPFARSLFLFLGCLLCSAVPGFGQPSEACPETNSFWQLQCAQDPGSTTVCRAGMENLSRCVITETDVIQWNKNDGSFETTASLAALSNANLFAALCSQLAGPKPKVARDTAESEYLALMLNVCVGALPLDAQVSAKGFGGTIAVAIDAFENALNTSTNVDFWSKTGTRINKGNVVIASECADPDALFSSVPPCP